MRYLLCTVLVLASMSFAQQAGPFGLTAGMTRKQAEQIVGTKAVISEHGDDVTYSTVPQPHPLFEQYILTFSRRYGLVEVQANAFGIYDDRSGRTTRSKCEDVVSTLSKKYGKPDQNTGCELRTETESPCKLKTGSFRWSLDSARADKVDFVSLTDSLLPAKRNERGEEVVAECNDPHAQWKGVIMLFYMFADYSKYQEEVKSTL